MANNNIPVSGSGKAAKQTPSAPEPDSKPGSSDLEPVQPETIRVESPVVESEDDDAVEGQVTLAVKVTKKRQPTQRDVAAKADYAPRYSTPMRRPAAKRPASFNPLAWVADGVTGAIEEVRHNDLGLSQDFWTHLYAVRRESLLTAQALVESLIAKVEGKGDEQEERKQRRERRGSVDIDF